MTGPDDPKFDPAQLEALTPWGRLAHRLAIENDAWDGEVYAEASEALAVAQVAATLDLAAAMRSLSSSRFTDVANSAPIADALAVLLRNAEQNAGRLS